MYPPQCTQLDDLRVVYREAGAGSRHVVFVHGWASSSRMWAEAMRALSGEFHCWALDLAGFGDSGQPQDGWCSIANWTRQVVQFSRAMGIRRPAIVGHSMGGMIALNVEVQEPGFVERVALINPITTGRVRFDLQLLGRSPLSGLMFKLGTWAWPLAVTPALADPFGVRSRLRGSFKRNQEDWSKVRGDTAIRALGAVASCDLTEHLACIQAPTLVILGDRDLTAPNREGRLVVERVSDSRLVVLRAGHLPTDDAPQATHRALQEFLDGRDHSPAASQC